MVTWIAWGVLFSLVFYYVYRLFRYKEKTNAIVDDAGIVELKDVILFSTYDVAKYIKASLGKNKGYAKLSYHNGEYVLFSYNNRYEDILRKFNEVHEDLSKQYDEYNMSDDIDELILGLWIKHGNKKNYRDIFKREIKYLLENEYIIKSVYIDTYNRFYKFL